MWGWVREKPVLSHPQLTLSALLLALCVAQVEEHPLSPALTSHPMGSRQWGTATLPVRSQSRLPLQSQGSSHSWGQCQDMGVLLPIPFQRGQPCVLQRSPWDCNPKGAEGTMEDTNPPCSPGCHALGLPAGCTLPWSTIPDLSVRSGYRQTAPDPNTASSPIHFSQLWSPQCLPHASEGIGIAAASRGFSRPPGPLGATGTCPSLERKIRFGCYLPAQERKILSSKTCF